MYTLLRTLRFHDNNQEKNSAVLRNSSVFSSQVIGWQLRLHRIIFRRELSQKTRRSDLGLCFSDFEECTGYIQPCDNPRRHRVVAGEDGGRFGFRRPLPPDPHNTLFYKSVHRHHDQCEPQ